MTKENAIDIIKCLAWHTRPNEEDIEQAIKALEQEQEPKISLEVYKQVARERDIAIEQLHELGYEFGEKIEPKTGHWVKTPKAVMGEGYMWYCDRCEHKVYSDSSRPYPSEKYCPNCGAKMVEEPTNSISAHDLVQEILKNNGVVDL